MGEHRFSQSQTDVDHRPDSSFVGHGSPSHQSYLTNVAVEDAGGDNNISTASVAAASPILHRHRQEAQYRRPQRQSSLKNISTPSYATFSREQHSSIPIAYRSPQPTSSSHHSRPSSYAAQPSPRAVESPLRPISIDSVVAHTSRSELLTAPKPQPTAPISSTVSRTIPIRKRPSSIPIDERYSRPRQRQTSRPSSDIPMSSKNDRLKPHMILEFDGVQRTLSSESVNSDTSDKRAKSPSRLGAFFGWTSKSATSSPKAADSGSPTTTLSEKSPSSSRAPSPGFFRSVSNASQQPTTPTTTTKMTSRLTPASLDVDKANSNGRHYDNPVTPIHVDTPGIAGHVQEIERELTHISSELANSIRREMDLEDEIERLKLEIPSVPPSEMSRRGSDYFSDSGAGSIRYPISDPDAKLEEAERLRRKAEQDKAQIKLDMAQRVQLELAQRRELDEHVRRLQEELERRGMEEIERKDKRVEELEAQLDDTKRRLNQEKEAKQNFEDLYTALQSELTSGGRKGMGRGFDSIAEESDDVSSGARGLTRSGSLARRGAGSLTRSGSVKDREGGRQRSGSASAPVTAEGLKEVEDQRDALQKALKLLISRHEKQRKDHERHLKKLARQYRSGDGPDFTYKQRSGYQRDVTVLKEEVTTLRKRTEDALEAKWQYEKSLGGIKMDLDRAEQETRGLRSLLKEHDIMAPSPRTMHGMTFGLPETDQILSAAESDREQARQLAQDFRKRAAQLGQGSRETLQLQQAADRMDQLTKQFDEQARTNNDLRVRLALAVEKGEREQQQSTTQIEEMQKRLAGMEDSVLAAQQHSETSLSTHETEVRSMEEATSPRLQRLHVDVPDSSKLSPISPGLLRSKSVGAAKKVGDVSLLKDVSRTHRLERKVRDLERLLRDAEDDMEYVVQRVNRSQLEVAELTNERDAAFTQMRKLQDKLVEETERAEALLPAAAR